MQRLDLSHSRREFLGAVAGAGAVGTAGCLGDDDDNDARTPEQIVTDWLGPATNYDDEDDIADQTGEESIVIENGTGQAGSWTFTPPAVRIDAGTEVTWEWVSNGHTVTLITAAGATLTDWEDHDSVEGTGFEHTETFPDAGIALYECRPHRAQGQLGAIIVE